MATTLVLASAMCLLIAPLWFVYKPPEVLLRYFQHRWPDVLWRVSTSSKIVALTIDDAPSEYTNEIMQILKSHNASATFFIIGSQVAGNEKTLQDLVKNGNELGNHGISLPSCFSPLHLHVESRATSYVFFFNQISRLLRLSRMVLIRQSKNSDA